MKRQIHRLGANRTFEVIYGAPLIAERPRRSHCMAYRVPWGELRHGHFLECVLQKERIGVWVTYIIRNKIDLL